MPLTLNDLQRMGEASAQKDPDDTVDTQLALSVYVNELRKMRLKLSAHPQAQRAIAQASQKLAAAAKALQCRS